MDQFCRLLCGDSRLVLPTLAAGSIDAVVCDPPYAIAMMGREWDTADVAFSAPFWRSVLATVKPGAHLLAFGHTRTYHRLVCAIEDAGWQIRDTIVWHHAQGFNKSGTQLKPATELICLARAPLGGSERACIARYGTGGLQTDACRTATGGEIPTGSGKRDSWRDLEGRTDRQTWNGGNVTTTGRYPANALFSHSPLCEARGVKRVKGESGGPRRTVTSPMRPGQAAVARATPGHNLTDGTEQVEDWICHESCPVGLLDRQSGECSYNPSGVFASDQPGGWPGGTRGVFGYGDTGGASRFFFCSKPSTAERSRGLGERNPHISVKPLELCQWLVRLITPSGGTVLDPFLGSGTTLAAALAEGFSGIGIEQDAAMLEVARQRLGLLANLEKAI